MNREDYKELVKSYKDKARKKFQTLKSKRKSRRKLPVADQMALRKKDRAATRDWKQRINKTVNPKSRKAQKKGYKLFRKLQHRKYKIAVTIIVLAIIVGLLSWWYITATKPLTTEQQLARDQSLKIAKQEMDESMVLLRNKHHTLPLKNSHINVFGVGSANTVYGGGGAGGISTTSVDSLYQAFDKAGLKYNKDLYNLYNNFAFNDEASTDDYTPAKTSLLDTLLPTISGFLQVSPEEMPTDKLPDSVMKTAKDYSDTAVYVVSRVGMETKDFKPTDLELSKSEKATLQKLDNNFNHVVVLANSTNVMELGFVEEMKHIDSVLWIGAPGEIGSHSVAEALKGEVNPSGRLTDTYAYNIESNPAVTNTGSFEYTNRSGGAIDRYFVDYEEGPFVGYRYYETFVSDDKYDDVVQYPFGYGMSYTSFDWDVIDTKATKNKIQATVKVKNTGDLAGKDVVQMYYSAPFYKDGIDKSAIELGDYVKTKLLKPGQSETLKLSFNTNDMASYDDQKKQAWVLDKGNYEISISKNVHQPVDRFNYSQTKRLVINKDNATGATVTNRFDQARGDLTYLSRSNPKKTMPEAPTGDDFIMPDKVKAADYEHVKSTEPAPAAGGNNGIKLKDLKGLDYNDPKWDSFLGQLKDKELVELVGNGGYWSVAIKRLGIPKTTMYDGPASIRSFLGAWATVAYPTPVNLSATWNKPLAEAAGEAMGREAKSFNVDAAYAPSLNMHRSPLGGRNFEYYSEDPLIAGSIGAAWIKGFQSNGTVAIMKHFAVNDQETHRADFGLYTWLSEQSLREIYLKPFEMAVKQADAHGAMSAFNRIGAIWAGGDKALLTDVLRTEWGFEGFVITDAGVAMQGEHFDALQANEAGNDLILAFLIDTPGSNKFEKQLKSYLKEDRAGTLIAMRKSAHHILYYVLNSNEMQ
ncbi:MAG: glycoside hydrolase family 3 C-terminal domain-containing protein [bacterium]|nr:glycoside hydrolase family 3 C-terminal domain-containing protein [bacterium]